MRLNRVQSEVWLRADIENILQGLDIASAAIDDMRRPEGGIYRVGFHDALQAVAAAIGGELKDAGVRVRVIEPKMIEGGDR